MFQGTSYYADSVDVTMLYIVGISLFFLLGIVAVMFYFTFRYSRRRNPKATQIEGNTALEIVWTVIPLFIVLNMFYLGWKDFYKLREMSDVAMTVQVKGLMWKWEFTYPNGKVTDTIYVPVGKVTKLEMRSADVNHAFFIPAFRLKEDVIANRTTYLVLTPDKTGEFDVACAEYCGLNHAYMYTMLKVVEQDVFDAWLYGDVEKIQSLDSTIEATQKTASVNLEDYSKQITRHDKFNLLNKYACLSCHTTDGSNSVGPSFVKLSDGTSKVETDGRERTVAVDSKYLRSSILEPDVDIVVGYKPYMMPSLRGRISDRDLDDIIDIFTIK